MRFKFRVGISFSVFLIQRNKRVKSLKKSSDLNLESISISQISPINFLRFFLKEQQSASLSAHLQSVVLSGH